MPKPPDFLITLMIAETGRYVKYFLHKYIQARKLR